MYGTQTGNLFCTVVKRFENDVEMYGTQTSLAVEPSVATFENDVEMYGTQTFADLNDIFL